MNDINKEQLQKLIKGCVNYVELGEELGVHPATAKKWVSKLGIPSPFERSKPKPNLPPSTLFGKTRKMSKRPKEVLDFH